MIITDTVSVFALGVQLDTDDFIIESGTIVKLLRMASSAVDETLGKLSLVPVVEESRLICKP